jgi:hypothetical protein
MIVIREYKEPIRIVLEYKIESIEKKEGEVSQGDERCQVTISWKITNSIANKDMEERINNYVKGRCNLWTNLARRDIIQSIRGDNNSTDVNTMKEDTSSSTSFFEFDGNFKAIATNTLLLFQLLLIVLVIYLVMRVGGLHSHMHSLDPIFQVR